MLYALDPTSCRSPGLLGPAARFALRCLPLGSVPSFMHRLQFRWILQCDASPFVFCVQHSWLCRDLGPELYALLAFSFVSQISVRLTSCCTLRARALRFRSVEACFGFLNALACFMIYLLQVTPYKYPRA